MYPNIRVLHKIGCTLRVSSAEAERSFSDLQRIKSYLRNRMSDERLSGLALVHLTLMLTTSVQSLLPSTREGCSKRASFTSRMHVYRKRPRKLTLNQNYNVQPRLVGGGGRFGGEVICRKKISTVFSESVWTFQSKLPESAPVSVTGEPGGCLTTSVYRKPTHHDHRRTRRLPYHQCL